MECLLALIVLLPIRLLWAVPVIGFAIILGIGFSNDCSHKILLKLVSKLKLNESQLGFVVKIMEKVSTKKNKGY